MYEFKTKFQGFPDRDSLKYKEIEGFEDYELLSCVVYEAAIRVPEIRNALNKFHRLYYKSKSQYGRYKLGEKVKDWHHELGLKKYGFDIEAAIFYAKKKEDPSFTLKNKTLISTPSKYTESLDGDIIRIVQLPNGEIRRRNMRTHLLNQSIDWDEFGFAPVFNLKIEMQRPIIKKTIRHKYFSVPLNFNLSKDELVKQITVMKEVFDKQEQNSQAKNEAYIESLKKNLPLDDGPLKDTAIKLMAHSSHSGEKNLLSAGDLGVGGPLFYNEFKGKKHNPSKTFADIFYVYDCMKEREKYNLALEGEKEYLKNEIKHMDYEDEDMTLNDLKLDYEKKIFSKEDAMKEIYLRIKNKNETRGRKSTSKSSGAPSSISEKWTYAQELIDNKMYESVM